MTRPSDDSRMHLLSRSDVVLASIRKIIGYGWAQIVWHRYCQHQKDMDGHIKISNAMSQAILAPLNLFMNVFSENILSLTSHFPGWLSRVCFLDVRRCPEDSLNH